VYSGRFSSIASHGQTFRSPPAKPGVYHVIIRDKIDFVHSYIVFQHITPRRGEILFASLLSSLCDGGIGAVHFTYADQSGWKTRAYNWCREKVPGVSNVLNIMKGRNWNTPCVQMKAYSLSRIVELLYEHGCGDIYALLDGTQGMQLGMFLFFRKSGRPYPDWRTGIEAR